MRMLLLSTSLLSTLVGMTGLAAAESPASSEQAGQDDGQSAAPQPGSLQVRLNGRFNFYAAYVDDQQFNTAGNKQANYTTGDYFRAFPGVDGVAANGLKYGASVEIRENGSVAPGGGSNGGIYSASEARGELFVYRSWGYIGTDKFGSIRVGTDDGPNSLYITGTFENFNDGGWDGDVPFLLSGNDVVVFPFADYQAVQNEIMYLSPEFYGFDFGVAYMPNTGNDGANNGNCANAATTSGVNGLVYGASAANGCDRLSSTTSLDIRQRNTIDALLRYRGNFGPIGVGATAGYIGSGKTAYTGPAIAGTITNYQGLSVGDFGVAFTYGGFQFGGNYQFGQLNGAYSLLPSGAKDENAWIAGASYTAGPVIVGGSFFNSQSAGDALAAGQRAEYGAAAGATYTLAPGVSLFLSYLWGQRKQSGYNFVTGADSGPTASQDNKVRSQVLALGTQFSW